MDSSKSDISSWLPPPPPPVSDELTILVEKGRGVGDDLYTEQADVASTPPASPFEDQESAQVFVSVEDTEGRCMGGGGGGGGGFFFFFFFFFNASVLYSKKKNG